MKTATFTRKPADLNDLANPYLGDDEPTPYAITETVTLTPAAYDTLGRNLMAQTGFLTGKGGMRDGTAQCIAVKARGRKTLLINPEGYSYARMAAFA